MLNSRPVPEHLLQCNTVILSDISKLGHLEEPVKDGASFCYCAYVLCISGYSGFLRNLLTNTTIFSRSLRLFRKSSS